MDVLGLFVLVVFYVDVMVGVELMFGMWWFVLSLLMSFYVYVCEIVGYVLMIGGWVYCLVSGFGIIVFLFVYFEMFGGIG